MKVSVLIVNFNGAHLLKRCLDALRAQTVPPYQVLVVDNGSSDGSKAVLEAYSATWPLLQCLYLPTNTGFSGGNNAGLPLLDGELIALLNTDAVVCPAWIEAALPAFQSEQVGMLACKTVRLEDPSRIDKVGHLIYGDGLNRGRGTGQVDHGQFDQAEELLWPDGSAAFYRKAMLDEIGFLDDDFFLYGEDAELGMRARWAGWSCWYEPRCLVYHHHSAGLGKFSPRKAYFIERNRIWLLVKTFPLGLVVRSPWHTVLRYAYNVKSLLRGSGSAAGFRQSHSAGTLLKTLLQANWDGFWGIAKMWRKRRSYPRRISDAAMVSLMNRYRISAEELALQD